MARGKRSSSLYFMPVWVVMIYWGVAKTIERGSISIECISCFIYTPTRKILPISPSAISSFYSYPGIANSPTLLICVLNLGTQLIFFICSKNLSVGEKLAMTEEFQKEVALENERRKSEAITESNKNRNSNTLQLECNENEPKSRSDTWTDSQTAKKAGVGVGTVARYNQAMNSDDEKCQLKCHLWHCP